MDNEYTGLTNNTQIHLDYLQRWAIEDQKDFIPINSKFYGKLVRTFYKYFANDSKG